MIPSKESQRRADGGAGFDLDRLDALRQQLADCRTTYGLAKDGRTSFKRRDLGRQLPFVAIMLGLMERRHIYQFVVVNEDAIGRKPRGRAEVFVDVGDVARCEGHAKDGRAFCCRRCRHKPPAVQDSKES